MKHISDNALQGMLKGTRTWESLIPRLRVVEGLLRNTVNREGFSHWCVGPAFPSQQAKLARWSASLKGLRWHAVAGFCQELLRLEHVLRIFCLLNLVNVLFFYLSFTFPRHSQMSHSHMI